LSHEANISIVKLATTDLFAILYNLRNVTIASSQ